MEFSTKINKEGRGLSFKQKEERLQDKRFSDLGGEGSDSDHKHLQLQTQNAKEFYRK